MSHPPTLTHQHPLWKLEDSRAPVRDLDAALRFFTQVLGFTATRVDHQSVRVVRDAAMLLLVQDASHDPATAGSCAWRTTDLPALRTELATTGAHPGAIEIREHEGKPLHLFFVRESTNGYCFAFSQPGTTASVPAAS